MQFSKWSRALCLGTLGHHLQRPPESSTASVPQSQGVSAGLLLADSARPSACTPTPHRSGTSKSILAWRFASEEARSYFGRSST